MVEEREKNAKLEQRLASYNEVEINTIADNSRPAETLVVIGADSGSELSVAENT